MRLQAHGKLSFLISLIYYASVTALCLLAVRLIPWFWPFLTSLVLAFIFKSLARRFRARSRAAAVAAGIVFYCAVALIFWGLTAAAVSAVFDFSQKLPGFFSDTLLPAGERLSERFIQFISRFAPGSAISIGELFSLLSAAAHELVTELSAFFLSWATGFLKGLPLFFIGFVFMIVSSFSIAMDYDRVMQFIMRQLPHRARPVMFDIKNFLLSCLFKLFKAYAVIMLITFAELCIGLWALGIKGFWKYAAAIAALDILPVFGSGIVLVPWGILELSGGRGALGAGLLLLYGVMVVLRNIVEPHAVGDSLGLHPVVTLTAMFFGLRALGIAGMLAAPVAALLIRFLHDNKKLTLYR